jgi:hypothetical protein
MLAAGFGSACKEQQSSAACGRFSNPISATWGSDGRRMKLLADVIYKDSAGLEWPVPAGWEVDGASIPPAAWSFIGGPFEGKYRDASVIHDYYCDKKSRPWQAVHLVFHDAMLCCGVKQGQARLMYGAVYVFGPRWTLLSGQGLEDPDALIVDYMPVFEKADVAELRKWIATEQPSPAEIRSRIDQVEVLQQ